MEAIRNMSTCRRPVTVWISWKTSFLFEDGVCMLQYLLVPCIFLGLTQRPYKLPIWNRNVLVFFYRVIPVFNTTLELYLQRPWTFLGLLRYIFYQCINVFHFFRTQTKLPYIANHNSSIWISGGYSYVHKLKTSFKWSYFISNKEHCMIPLNLFLWSTFAIMAFSELQLFLKMGYASLSKHN